MTNKMIATIFALMFAFMPTQSQARPISDSEAAAIALGTAAILAGVAIASQRRKPRHHNHYYHHPYQPHYYRQPPPLRYRYQEPRYYQPRHHHYRY